MNKLQKTEKEIIDLITKWYSHKVAFPKGWSDERFLSESPISYKTYDSGNISYINIEIAVDSALNGNKFDTVKVNISYRKSTSVEVIDQEAIPEQYLRTVTTVSPDKTEIAKALKVGELVDGVALKETNNIQIK